MTDMAIRQASGAPRTDTAERVRKSLKRRYASERRFKVYGLAAICMERRLIDDDSFLDFQTHVAVGFAASNGAHMAVRFQHLSNGSIRAPNAGSNLVGLAVGFTF